ncbi:MAG: CHAD domain-containing protein [Nitrospiraceae bacterium]|nr:CHAD domain-containing protein [Nitrospiraceae bacterium]
MAKYCSQASDSAVKAFKGQARALRKHAPAAAREDADGVHDIRVASRRLRAVLAEHGVLFKKSKVKRLNRNARRVTSVLGKPRELDVTIALLEPLRPDFHGPARYAINHVLRNLRAQRSAQSHAIRRTARFVQSREFRKALRDLYESKPRVRCHLRDAVANTTTRFDAVVAAHEAWRETQSEALLHELRIAFKKFRYTCEVYRDIYGAEMAQLIARLREVQECLGEWHDYFVVREYVAQALPSAPPRAAEGMPLFLRLVNGRIDAMLAQFSERAESFFGPESSAEVRAFLAGLTHVCHMRKK